MTEYVLRHGEWKKLTPEDAGWTYVSFEVPSLAPGESVSFEANDEERAFIPLLGTVTATSPAGEWTFGGRASVFDGLASCLYLPRDTAVTITAGDTPVEVAVCGAKAENKLEPVLITPDDLDIEVRGFGNATRQISTLLPPGFAADKLHVVEVWTPGGNWSSYPPHKHDEHAHDESVLEETYYYRTRRPEGFAMQRLYSPKHELDYTATVRDGDLLYIPHGYHTTVAAQGHDLYYLNVLAGPNEHRTLQASDDPSLADVRELWETLEPDPRVPFVPRYSEEK